MPEAKDRYYAIVLPNGTNIPRQLSNLTGGITLTARYTPCPLHFASGVLREGDALDTYGNGNFTFGYPSIQLHHSGQASAESWTLPPGYCMWAMDSIMIPLQADSSPATPPIPLSHLACLPHTILPETSPARSWPGHTVSPSPCADPSIAKTNDTNCSDSSPVLC